MTPDLLEPVVLLVFWLLAALIGKALMSHLGPQE